MTDLQQRAEIQALRDAAQTLAATPGLNQDWESAYRGVAFALDRLDAMIARTSVPAGTSEHA